MNILHLKCKAILSMVILFAGLTSCSNNDFSEDHPNQSLKENSISTTAIKFVQSINGDGGTRATRQSVGVQTITEVPLPKQFVSTRSSDGGPKFYAVSMSNQQGTVLLSKEDNTVQPLAYFMKENNMNVDEVMKDTISDLAFIFKSAIEENLEESTQPRKLTSTTNDLVVEERLEPKCKVYWGQGYPYNKYCFTSDGKQAAAGCVAIAGAQAATVLRPKFSMITSWDEAIKKYPSNAATDEIAKLVAYIGKQVDMDYGELTSGADVRKLTPIFEKFGIKDYDAERAIDVLKTQHGVIVVSGYRVRHGWWTHHYYDGHAFLADGYIKYKNEDDPYYLHLNYGWGDQKGNAYVLSSEKNWNEEEGKATFNGKIYTFKVRFYTYAYENEINW